MKTIDIVKKRLIDKIMVTENEQLLKAIETIFKSTQKEEMLNLNSDQIEMLMMSEDDIKYGNVVAEEDIEKSDS